MGHRQIAKKRHEKTESNKVGVSRAEKQLVVSLMAALRKSENSAMKLASELDCFQGVADVVSGIRSGYRLLPDSSKGKLQSLSFSTSKVLAALVDRKRATTSEIADTTGLSAPTIRSELNLLQKLGILRVVQGKHIAVLHTIRAPFKDIAAYEVKVKDWRSGIYQARNYKSFAHRVSVALPLARAKRLADKLPEFRRMRVGLVGIDSEGQLKWLLRPRRRKPISLPRHFHAAVRLLGEM